jgi:uncharacterized protein
MNIFYLHGLASGPNSNKARFYQQHLGALVPDLNVPTFETLTLTAILVRVQESIAAAPNGGTSAPHALIGSSLGGLSALHFADRYRQSGVQKLILMAPALDFMHSRSTPEYAAELAQWQRDGYQLWHHHAYGEQRRLHYGLVEDIRTYDSYAVQLDIPILIYHGRNDASVDYRLSERFAQGRPNVQLHILDSDHQLLDQTDFMLDGIRTFLGL